MPGARTLPFVGFITHDGKWVGGYAGSKQPGAFLDVLNKAADTPYLKASKATRKKLAGIVARAEKAAAKDDWKTVIKSGKDVAKTTGRCPERQQMAKLIGRAHAWGDKELKRAVTLAQSADDVAEPRKVLMAVKKNLSGEPEAADAAVGL